MTAHVPPLHRRAVAVFLLVGLPVLALGVAMVLALGQSRLRDLTGQHLEQVATQTASAVDTYMFRRVLDVSVLGRVPVLRDAAVASSARPYGGEAERQAAEATSRSSPRQAAVESPASRFLADLTSQDQIYQELLLTDRHGRLVAASTPTAGYLHADQDWWLASYGDGRTGRAILTDLSWDASSGRHAVAIAVPLTAPDSGTLAGILKVVTDSREMLAMIGGVQLGSTGEAQIVRPDGSIVFSRRPIEPSARFFAADGLRERAAQLASGEPLEGAYFKATNRGKTMLVGAAPSQLVRSFPNVAWYIVVTQAEEELASALQGLGWYLLLTFALTVIAILAFALWFSMQLAKPVVETDIHLVEHPPVMHVGETDDPIVIAR
jgi:hypothetical protein